MYNCLLIRVNHVKWVWLEKMNRNKTKQSMIYYIIYSDCPKIIIIKANKHIFDIYKTKSHYMCRLQSNFNPLGYLFFTKKKTKIWRKYELNSYALLASNKKKNAVWVSVKKSSLHRLWRFISAFLKKYYIHYIILLLKTAC